MIKPSTSPRWKINLTDYWKSVRGGAVVFVAAAYPVFLDQLEIAFGGEFTLDVARIVLAFKVAVVATLVELGRRYVTNYSKNL